MDINSFSSRFMDSLACIAGNEQVLTALFLIIFLALLGWAVEFFMDFGSLIYTCMKRVACKLWRKHHF